MSGGPERRLQLRYAGSSSGLSDAPPADRPEIVIAGRSNAGKSSLLNVLGGDHTLARVSKTPGRTQRLHFFDGGALGVRLVDLPGYGWARASRSERERWGHGIEEYLVGRPTLAALVLLSDVRRDPGEDEQEIAAFVERRGIGMIRVATKIDKLGRSELMRRMKVLETSLPGGWIGFSARSGAGRNDLVRAIAELSG